jgi:hypothetical protein
MPQTCKRRPGGGGAAVHSLAGDAPHYSSVLPEILAPEARAADFAADWLVRRFRVSPNMAAAIVEPAGLRGLGR